MEVIIPDTVEDIEQARKIITDLQVRLLKGEQILDDLVRSVEIAEITKQYHLTTSFRVAGEEFLQDRIVLPKSDDNEDLKIKIYE